MFEAHKLNALGQQVVVRNNDLGQTIHIIHDIEGNRLAEYLVEGSKGTLLREYIWLNGMPVGVVDGTFDTVSFVRTDHIGRPVFATNQNGTKVWAARYLPFGQVQTSGGDNINLRFPGQWFNAMTGFHQNWMRDYDPTLGRYIQADPLGLVDGAAVYTYALQNPHRYTDPRGEQSISLPGPVPLPIPVPLPPAFTPGTPEATGLGQQILDLSGRYNPIDRGLQWIVSMCSEEREQECFEQYERDMDSCGEIYQGCIRMSHMPGLSTKTQCFRSKRVCEEHAFRDYQACRGL